MVRQKKYTRVILKGSGPWSACTGNTEQAGDPPETLWDEYYQNGVKGVWTRHLSIEVDIEGSIENAIKILRKASEGFDEARVSVDTYQDPYSDYFSARTYVRVIRPATAEELVWIKRAQAKEAEVQAENREAEIVALRNRLARLMTVPEVLEQVKSVLSNRQDGRARAVSLQDELSGAGVSGADVSAAIAYGVQSGSLHVDDELRVGRTVR